MSYKVGDRVKVVRDLEVGTEDLDSPQIGSIGVVHSVDTPPPAPSPFWVFFEDTPANAWVYEGNPDGLAWFDPAEVELIQTENEKFLAQNPYALSAYNLMGEPSCEQQALTNALLAVAYEVWQVGEELWQGNNP